MSSRGYVTNAAPHSLFVWTASQAPAMICMMRGLLHACSFYDPDVGDRGLRRMQRKARPSFEFVKQGVFQRQAERQRLTVSALPLHGMNPPIFSQKVVRMGRDIHLTAPRLSGYASLCILLPCTLTVLKRKRKRG